MVPTRRIYTVDLCGSQDGGALAHASYHKHIDTLGKGINNKINMANVDNELIKRLILPALENAVRLEYVENGPVKSERVKEYERAHLTLTRKVFRSEEARTDHYMARSISSGSDFGTAFVKGQLLERFGVPEDAAIKFTNSDYDKDQD